MQQLKTFLSVAETLHFTSAARNRGIGQSTVSQHISRLERRLGAGLLRRNTKQVELSGAGRKLLPLARELLRQHDALLVAFGSDKLTGSISVGVTEDIMMTRFPEVLGTFRAAYPEISVNLSVALSYQLRHRLEAGELDVFFGMRPIGELHGQALWHEPLRWLHNGGFQAVRGESIPLVLFPDGSITRRFAIQSLNNAGLSWHVSFVSEHLGAVLAAIRAGYGIGAQPAFMADGVKIDILSDIGLPDPGDVEFISVERLQDPGSPTDRLCTLIAARRDQLVPGTSHTEMDITI